MIKQILQEGFALKNSGYYKHAIEAFYKALELDNSCDELLLEIAESYYLMKDEERAINYIEQILNVNPTHIGSLRLLEKIFIDNCAWAEAMKTAENIYSIESNNENLLELIELLIKQGDFEKVLAFNDVTDDSKIFYNKAIAFLNLEDYDNAKKYIDKALEIEKTQEYLLLKGKILYKSKNFEETLCLLESFDANTVNPEILNFIGLIKQYKCEFEDALEFFLRATKSAPFNDEYFYNCASTYFKMGKNEQAKKYYNLAISLAPEKEPYHFALANLYYSEKHYKRALKELDVELPEAKLLKSVILYDAGYYGIARKEFEGLSVLQPDNELICDYLNRINEKMKN